MSDERPLRLLGVGAFPFPLAQGSQRFAAAQIRALREAGADAALVCYGNGDGREPTIPVVRAPRALSRVPLRSGPHPGKTLADAGLAAALAAAIRTRRPDAILAHNVEAALVAFAVRRFLRVPVVYVAHTLFSRELASYGPRSGPWARVTGAGAARLGEGLDRSCARRADAVIALSGVAARTLRPHARGPLAVLPPGHEAEPLPTRARIEAACRRHGLEPDTYAIYAGNLDGYQSLDRLEAAAAGMPEVPIVVATHARAPRRTGSLGFVHADSVTEMRALVHGARLGLLPRRIAGGFPLKLLDYMEAGLGIVATASSAETLVPGHSGRLLSEQADADAWRAAIRGLFHGRAEAARLGEAARQTLAFEHAWPDLARRTLAVAREAASSAVPHPGYAPGRRSGHGF